MEAQLPPLYFPAYCNYGTAFQPAPSFAKPQPPLYQQLIPSPPLLVPSGSGQFFIQMQQILPILSPDTALIPPCAENLAQVIPCYPNNQVFDPAAAVPLNLHQKLHQVCSTSSVDSTLTKTLRKKKVSPSAKRRSRLRLIAFLEAKKEKCGPLSLEQNCDVTIPQGDEKTTNELETTNLSSNEEQASFPSIDGTVEIES